MAGVTNMVQVVLSGTFMVCQEGALSSYIERAGTMERNMVVLSSLRRNFQEGAIGLEPQEGMAKDEIDAPCFL